MRQSASGGTWLAIEVGCGPAQREPRSDFLTAVGIDLAVDCLRQARESSVGWTFVAADARALPFADRSCGSVAMRAVLHHLAPAEVALIELARVLRSGGLLTIVDGVLLPEDEVARLEGELLAAGLPAEPCYGFALDDVTAMVETVGLVVEDVALAGVATFATPPFVSRAYTTDRFVLTARRPTEFRGT